MKYAPQLATLVKEPPSGDEWLHELKYDGYRIGAVIERGAVHLLSRNGKDWTERFAPVRDAVERLGIKRGLLDGEVAAVLADGRTSFQALQSSSASSPLVYFVFDLLHLDGEDVAALPLEERKARLHTLLGGGKGVVRYADHIAGGGQRVFEAACEQRAEGIVSKRRDRPYQPGRGLTWVKTKCIQRQEVIIGGFTDPEGARAGIGALLVGVRDGARLLYSGKVGTGFTQKSARDLRAQLENIAQRESPFTTPPTGKLGRTAHWVRPELVAEVAFTEWTDDGKIRHPSFQGLRADKKPADVVRETAVAPPPSPGKRAAKRKAGAAAVEAGVSPAAPKAPAARARGRDARPHSDRSPSPRTSAARSSSKSRAAANDAHVGGVKLTHPERVMYPDVGITKLELAEFYESIGTRILPHIADRPLTLVRCPDGVGPSCFYMKHASTWGSSALRRVKIREKTKIGEYLLADSAEAVISLVQMGVLEIHTWNSTATHLEQPDRFIIDLDPGPDVEWPAVIAAAQLVRQALDHLGLQSFVKTTGGHGLHVVVPLVPEASWDECLEFSRALSEAVVRLDPRAYTTNFSKAGRRKQILLDYMRNNRGSTAVAAFSTRARANAPVSVPLAWDELSPRLRSDHFTVRNLAKRLAAQRSDPWKGFATLKQRLSADAAQRLEDVQ